MSETRIREGPERTIVTGRLFILLLLTAASALASTRLQEEQARLDSLAGALDRFRQESRALQGQQQTGLERLDRLQQQLSRSSQLVLRLQEQVTALDLSLEEGEAFLNRNQRTLDSLGLESRSREAHQLDLREQYREMVLRLFKGRREDPLFWLLASGSPGEAWERARWFPWFSRGLQRLQHTLEGEQQHLARLSRERQRVQLEQGRKQRQQEEERSLAEQNRQRTSESLQELRQDRRLVDEKLRQVQEDQRLLDQARVQAEAAQSGIREAVEKLQERWKSRQQRLESEASERESLQKLLGQEEPRPSRQPLRESAPTTYEEGRLSDLRGRKGSLDRPVQGRLARRYGMHRDAATGTQTDNPGCDYRCEPGAEVRLVHPGQVVRVTWLPGFGNTVLVDHGHGAISVYSKLESVIELPEQVLPAGTVIGRAGSFDEAGAGSVHFELWLERESQDPEKWLRR